MQGDIILPVVVYGTLYLGILRPVDTSNAGDFDFLKKKNETEIGHEDWPRGLLRWLRPGWRMRSGTLSMSLDAPYFVHGFILVTSIQSKHSRSRIYRPHLKLGSI